MCFSNTLLILFLIISNLILYITCQVSESTKKDICSLEKMCEECILCTDYSKCSFTNIFCFQNNTGQYKRDEKLQNNLNSYFKQKSEMNNFCNSRDIILDTSQKSFDIFESPYNTNNNDLSQDYHCNYYIENIHYLNHNTDTAKINFEIKKINNGAATIKFLLFFIYKSKSGLHFFHFNDTELRNASFSKVLDQIRELEILIDFFSVETSESSSENLVLSILTDNPSERLRIIYISIIVVLCFFLLVIIFLIILYFFLRKKIELEQERRIKEEEEENIKKKKIVEDFINKGIQSQVYNEKVNINNCDSCTICCDNFIIGQSEVYITPCSHIFHIDCIKKWFSEKIDNPICPNCNFQFMEYIKNPVKINIEKKGKIKIISNNEQNIENNNTSGKNVNIDLNQEQIRDNGDDIPSSEQLRINQKNKEGKEEIEKSIHLADDEENGGNNENINNNNFID